MPKMYHLSLDLEIVTPLFLGGADPRGQPELRPPAFRGALRYWLRAALCSAVGDQSLTALRNLEAAVFGDTTTGSPTGLRLSQPPLPHAPAHILPHKQNLGRRDAFSAGGMFKLRLDQVRNDDEAVWQAACTALSLALTFGGVGLRSRRGYGTVRVQQSSDAALTPVFPTTAADWETHARQALSNAVAAARRLATEHGIRVAALPNGPTIYPAANKLDRVRIYQGSATTAMAAVTEFMRKVQKDRALGGIGRDERQASPLWVRPIEMDGRYGLLLTVLASRFRGADYSWVQQWLDATYPAYRDITVQGWNA